MNSAHASLLYALIAGGRVLKAKRSSWVAGSAAPKMLNITLDGLCLLA